MMLLAALISVLEWR